MKHFIVYNADGEILRTGVCMDCDFEKQPGPGEKVIEGVADDRKQEIKNGRIVEKGGENG